MSDRIYSRTRMNKDKIYVQKILGKSTKMRNNQYSCKKHINMKSQWNKNYFEPNGMKLWYVKICDAAVAA